MASENGISVFVLGSCVTRDAISSEHNNCVELAGYVARTSLASQSNSAWSDKSILENINSSFQRRMVEFDMKKVAFEKIQSVDFDLLIIDFIDDRFDLVEFSKGCYATRSVEFLKGIDGRSVGRVIPHGSEEYESLWRLGFDKLLNFLRKCGKEGALRVNEVYWASTTNRGAPIKNFDKDRILKENKLLSQRYNYMRHMLEEDSFYSFENDFFIADENHKWGVSPFHYTPRYYQALIGKITCGFGV